jgi:hypothetical protein
MSALSELLTVERVKSCVAQKHAIPLLAASAFRFIFPRFVSSWGLAPPRRSERGSVASRGILSGCRQRYGQAKIDEVKKQVLLELQKHHRSPKVKDDEMRKRVDLLFHDIQD